MKSESLMMIPALIVALALMAGCGSDAPTPGTTDAGADADAQEGHAHEGSHGGSVVVLGDHAAHLEATHKDGVVTVWFTDANMEKALDPDEAPVLNVVTEDGSVRIEGEKLGDGWHFVDLALEGHPEKARFRFKLAGKSYTPDLPCDHGEDCGHEHGPDGGHAHEGDYEHGPHDGLVVPFHTAHGSAIGHLELKLHDDKGDLEVWLWKGEPEAAPFDLPLDAEIQVRFASGPQRSVTLRVRNSERNEDEDGVANIRDGKTNYFIFPGDTGADASFLKGAAYENDVTVAFSTGGPEHTTESFTLKPHTHADHDAGHDDHGHE